MPSIDLKDGGTMSYLDEGQGAPILFLHGWGTNSSFYKDQVARFSKDFRVIAPDLRGHGNSSRLPDGQGLETLADDVFQLLEVLELENVTACGWSMGAMVLWILLFDFADCGVSRVVVEDMSPKIQNDSDWNLGLTGPAEEILPSEGHVFGRPWEQVCESFIPRIFASNGTGAGTCSATKAFSDGSYNPHAIDPMAEAKTCYPHSMLQSWNSMVAQDFRVRLADLNVPTLIVYGEQSQLYRHDTSAWLEKTIRQSKRVAFSKSGHVPHLEEAEKYHHVVSHFIKNDGGDSALEASKPELSEQLNDLGRSL